MKILLLGKNGQLGWELQRSLSVLGEVVALDRAGANGLCGDLTDLEGLRQTVRQLEPRVIVNAAAYTAVDKAESEPELARTINALAPEVLAQEAAHCGAWLLHYSTDYVFDGSGSKPWQEDDMPAPLSVYGRTKLEAEQRVAATGCRHLIFRTSWVYGARGGNFARTMLRLAQERERLKVINDQIGAPTGADLLADVSAQALGQLLHIGQLRQNVGGPSGIYHVAAAGETSWHGYARFVLQTALAQGVSLKAGPDAVDAIPTTEYPTPARRPLNSRLDTARLRATFGVHLPSWQLGVTRLLAEIL